MADNTLQPSLGLLTWNAEGNNNPSSTYYSRRAHWPQGASGVTIGRGYDMKLKSKERVKADLITSGLVQADAEALSQGAGLSGEDAKKFVEKDTVRAIEISEQQQVALFSLSYSDAFSDARRICMKKDVEEKYGKCGWESMDAKTRELIADMRFRGDYSPWMRKEIQQDLLSGDKDKIIQSLERIQKIAKVPKDRHDMRVKFLQTGVR